jgi:NADP-dependent 3-hydroxy acid dehydrogenase YdfG
MPRKSATVTTAKALTERGAKAALLARSRDVLEELAGRLPGSLPIVADMTDFASVRAAIARAQGNYGRIDGLINNAGRGYGAAVRALPFLGR